MKSFFRDNGLTIALVAMFLFSAIGMIWSGHAAYNEELQNHGSASVGLLSYLASGDFLSALFENWESEFLQMSAYVMLTAMLFQRGSAESRDPDDPNRPEDELPTATRRRNPILSWLYSYSLGLRWPCCSSSHLPCIGGRAWRPRTRRRFGTAARFNPWETIFSTPSYGSSPFRTGSRNSCRRPSWSCCRFSYATRAPRNQSQPARQTPKPAHEFSACRQRSLCFGNRAVPATVAKVVVEEPALYEGVSERRIGLRRHSLVVITRAARDEPHRENPCLRIVLGLAD